jgi:hypothetical protein
MCRTVNRTPCHLRTDNADLLDKRIFWHGLEMALSGSFNPQSGVVQADLTLVAGTRNQRCLHLDHAIL